MLAEVAGILSCLTLGDNQIRSDAENAFDNGLAQSPELYVLALAQIAVSDHNQIIRSLSLILLRRILFRPITPTKPHSTLAIPLSTRLPPPPPEMLYTHLPPPTLHTLKQHLLHSLANETAPDVRRVCLDTVAVTAAYGVRCRREDMEWVELQMVLWGMLGIGAGLGKGKERQGRAREDEREAAFTLLRESPRFAMQFDTEAILEAFIGGLKDTGSVDVQLAAFQASVAYISSADNDHLSPSFILLHPLFLTLASFSHTPSPSHSSLSSQAQATETPTGTVLTLTATPAHPLFPKFIAATTSLAERYPPLIQRSLDFMLQLFSRHLFVPRCQCRGRSGPPMPGDSNCGEELEGVGADREEVRRAAMEFMITVCEARGGIVLDFESRGGGGEGWASVLVRACLEGMCAEDEDGEEDDVELWMQSDPSDDPTAASSSHLYSHTLSRLAIALGGNAVLPPLFGYVPQMLGSAEWKVRMAGLLAVAGCVQGCGEVLKTQIRKIIEMITPMFEDVHPRVRYAACECVGQLCMHLDKLVQEQYADFILGMLIPALEAQEQRVVAHAALAISNLCDPLHPMERSPPPLPHLDVIINSLLSLLFSDVGKPPVRRYVQEQVIVTLGRVAKASRLNFEPYYVGIMPLLLSEMGAGQVGGELRLKIMEAVGLIGVAVGPESFLPDVGTLAELLMQIQDSTARASDPLLNQAIIETWWSICQVIGPLFAPFLPVVMPLLISAANLKDGTTVQNQEDGEVEEREGWETIKVNRQIISIPTSVMEEKSKALMMLHSLCSMFKTEFIPYLPQTLEVALLSLRCFFHAGVQVFSIMIIPQLLTCGKEGGALTTQMVAATFHELTDCINSSPHASFVEPLYKCFVTSLEAIGGPGSLPQEYHDAIFEVTGRQMEGLTERRKDRAGYRKMGSENALSGLDRLDEAALEGMVMLLGYFDPNHPLLASI